MGAVLSFCGDSPGAPPRMQFEPQLPCEAGRGLAIAQVRVGHRYAQPLGGGLAGPLTQGDAAVRRRVRTLGFMELLAIWAIALVVIASL